jgi:hypothetical protein
MRSIRSTAARLLGLGYTRRVRIGKHGLGAGRHGTQPGGMNCVQSGQREKDKGAGAEDAMESGARKGPYCLDALRFLIDYIFHNG